MSGQGSANRCSNSLGQNKPSGLAVCLEGERAEELEVESRRRDAATSVRLLVQDPVRKRTCKDDNQKTENY